MLTAMREPYPTPLFEQARHQLQREPTWCPPAPEAEVAATDEMETALSPQRHLDKLNAPVIVAYGTLETPEFQRQSRDFSAAVRTAGKPVQLLVGEGDNQFEIIETMAIPYGLLGRSVLKQMKLV